jgi:hypothetical protein
MLLRDSDWPDPFKMKVRHVHVESGEARFDADKHDRRWRLRLPDSDRAPWADNGRLETLLRFVDYSKPLRRLGVLADGEAARYGLDRPRARLVLRGRFSWEIQLGGPGPSGDGVYATSSREPGQLLLLDSEYARQLDRQAPFYYDLRLTDLEASRIVRFRIQDGSGRGFEVKHPDKGQYAFSWPAELAGTEVAAGEASLFLHAATRTKAVALRLAPLPEAGEPCLVVELWAEDHDRPVRIDVHADPRRPGMFLARSTWQPGYFELDLDRVRQLQITSFAISDRHVVDFPLDPVKRMRLVRGGGQGDGSFAAERGEAGWTDERDGRDVLGVDMLLWRLRSLRSEPDSGASTSARAGGTAQPILTWDFSDQDGTVLASVAFLADAGLPEGRCWLRQAGAGGDVRVSDQLLKDLLARFPYH